MRRTLEVTSFPSLTSSTGNRTQFRVRFLPPPPQFKEHVAVSTSLRATSQQSSPESPATTRNLAKRRLGAKRRNRNKRRFLIWRIKSMRFWKRRKKWRLKRPSIKRPWPLKRRPRRVPVKPVELARL